MLGSQYYIVPRRPFLLGLITLVVVSFISLGVVLGALPHADKRLNQVHHFGGDAFYCVDANKTPTNDWSTMIAGGGFLLRSMGGQELYFWSAADILAAVQQSQATGGGGVPLVVGQGTYGPAYIYLFSLSDAVIDGELTAHDEHGKTETMPFRFCNVVGPAVGPDAPDEVVIPDVPMCTLVEVVFIQRPPQGLIQNGDGGSQQVACSSCPSIVGPYENVAVGASEAYCVPEGEALCQLQYFFGYQALIEYQYITCSSCPGNVEMVADDFGYCYPPQS
jgi:hypothetical protein